MSAQTITADQVAVLISADNPVEEKTPMFVRGAFRDGFARGADWQASKGAE